MLIMLLECYIWFLLTWILFSCVSLLLIWADGINSNSAAATCMHVGWVFIVFVFYFSAVFMNNIKICIASTLCFCSLIYKLKARAIPSNGEPRHWIDISCLPKSDSTEQSEEVELEFIMSFITGSYSDIYAWIFILKSVKLGWYPLGDTFFFITLVTFTNEGFSFVSAVTQWRKQRKVAKNLTIECGGKNAKK